MPVAGALGCGYPSGLGDRRNCPPAEARLGVLSRTKFAFGAIARFHEPIPYSRPSTQDASRF